jgi:hypothetical protein
MKTKGPLMNDAIIPKLFVRTVILSLLVALVINIIRSNPQLFAM